MISPERLDGLQRGFARLMEGYGVEPARAYPVFDRLVAAYEEPHRFYHTLEHVAEMLRVAGRLGGGPEVMLAVWFHDFVYDPRRSDNEVVSTLEATAELSALGIDQEVWVTVGALIAATGIDSAPPLGGPTSESCLTPTSPSSARPRRGTNAMRPTSAGSMPTSRTPNSPVAGLPFLRSFLDRPAIYFDPRMSEGEAAARANIAAECDRLEAAIAAG